MKKFSWIYRFLILLIVVFSSAIQVNAAPLTGISEHNNPSPQWSSVGVPADSTPPVISIWYGNSQVFGSVGTPQRWINILGNVSDPESAITSLTYRLNGGASQNLAWGPDNRRLQYAGDFNVEIDKSALANGTNTVAITATSAGGQSSQVVTVTYHANTIWPGNYSINWASVSNAQSVLQIVDGNWSWNASGIRPVQDGYDRVLAIGDLTWKNYEVLFPVTINAVDANAYTAPNATGPGLGVNIHWTGYTDSPVLCPSPRPHCGWIPTGASDWYAWSQTGADDLQIEEFSPSGTTKTNSIKFTTGSTYWFRARIQTGPSINTYSLKVWKNGDAEPANWTLQRLAQAASNQSTGSFILVAHYVDATFGNISVTSLDISGTGNKQVFLPLITR